MTIKDWLMENVVSCVPDELFLKIKYRRYMGKSLNLTNPKTFNEKLQWLKIHNREPEYTRMVDKYAVKEYVSDTIGEQYVIKTLDVWDRPEDIDWNKLPNQFVLKTTHGGGNQGVVICRDKSHFDKKNAIKKLNESLHIDLYKRGREWPYKNVPKKIIAEEFMEDGSGVGLKDYKIFCFDGEPKFLYLSQDLENHANARISFLNVDWTFAPFHRLDYKPFETLPEKPKNYEKMLDIARQLSKGLPHVRVDLYNINGEIYFGEMTFYTCSGMIPFEPKEWDEKLGRVLNLPVL